MKNIGNSLDILAPAVGFEARQAYEALQGKSREYLTDIVSKWEKQPFWKRIVKRILPSGFEEAFSPMNYSVQADMAYYLLNKQSEQKGLPFRIDTNGKFVSKDITKNTPWYVHVLNWMGSVPGKSHYTPALVNKIDKKYA